MEDMRKRVLAQYLSVDVEDIEESGWDDRQFSLGRSEYLVLTDDEADEKAEEYIEDSVWAFNAWFLADETGLPEKAFAALSELCEDANEPILDMIKQTCGVERFVEDAISADGRGHFLSNYDGEESEYAYKCTDEKLGREEVWYIYRTN